MPPNELIEAAERFGRECARESDSDPSPYSLSDSFVYLKDVERLARSYLAVLPWFDQTPLTEEWLLSVGFQWATHPLTSYSYLQFGQLTCRGDLWSFGHIDLSDVLKTRGDVRRLCAALDIELQEPHHASD